MSRYPSWIYVAVAAMIALVAFVSAQLVPGLGMIVVLAASFAWVAFNVRRVRTHG